MTDDDRADDRGRAAMRRLAGAPLRLTRGFPQDVRGAARRLLATPLFSCFAVLSLAIGVGATTAVYSVVDSLFLKGFGVDDPGRVVYVVTPYDGRMLKGSISQPDFEDLRAAQTSFSTISASAALYAAVASPSTTEFLAAEAVDGAYFSTFNVPTVIGRPIQPADVTGSARVVVLSSRLWRSRFAADPAIVGQTIRIAGRPFEVVGVAAASFEGVNGGLPDTWLWIPLSVEDAPAPHPAVIAAVPRDHRRLVVFGRLAPLVTEQTASAELGAIARRLDASFPPRPNARHAVATERPWKGKSAAALAKDDNLLRRCGLTLVGLVALVLVVACTNLANLVLARGTARQHELTIRYALGAPRWRLVREQCAESLLLAAAGAVAAFGVFQTLRVLLDAEFSLALPMGGRWTLAIHPTFDLTALGTAAAALLMSLVVFGLEPALQLTRSRDLRGDLAAGANRLGTPRAGRQRGLLRWQVAISTGFFVIATMFVRSTIAEVGHDSGVEIERLGVAVLDFRAQQWDQARGRRMLDRIMEEARKDPAIESVSASTAMPFGIPGAMRLALSVPDSMIVDADDYQSASGIAATPLIFRTMGVPILRGRTFDDRDHGGAAPVVVVSEFTARRMFGTIDAVGRQLRLQNPASGAPIATVIGVARDTDVGRFLGDPRPFVYLPLAQRYDPRVTIAVRSRGDANQAVRALRDALRRADPDLAVDVMGTGRAVLAGPFQFLRGAGLAALGLGALTLGLAMVGLFGIESHIVAHRIREIGVRMSLGASAGQIQRMVLKDGYRPVLEGLGIGLFIGIVGRAIVRAYLDIDGGIVDPWMLLVVPAPLILAAFCACYLPARRAARVDPNVALRHL